MSACNERFAWVTYRPVEGVNPADEEFDRFVLALQEVLNAAGYGPIAEDACLGPATAAAATRFRGDYVLGRLGDEYAAYAASIDNFVSFDFNPNDPRRTPAPATPLPGGGGASPAPPVFTPLDPTPMPAPTSAGDGALLLGLLAALALAAGRKRR